MTYVSSLVAPERLFGDIRSMISDPLKGTSNEDEIHAAWHELRVRAGSLNELFIEVIDYGIQLSVFGLERPCKLVVTICKRAHAIVKNRYG